MNILVTAGTTAAAFRVSGSFPGNNLIFADNPLYPVPSVLSQKFITIPFADKDSFIHDLLSICLDLSADVLLPLRRDEIIALKNAHELFSEFGIRLCVPRSIETIHPATNPTGKSLVIMYDSRPLNVLTAQVNTETLPADGIFCFSGAGPYSLFVAD